jgi:hypothetical protein
MKREKIRLEYLLYLISFNDRWVILLITLCILVNNPVNNGVNN